MNFGGGITGGAAGYTTLFLAGAGSISGIIGNGAATTMAVNHNSFGTWNLTGANTYTGATTVSAGTLKSANEGALSTTSSVAVTGAGVLAVHYGGASDYTQTQVGTLLAKTTFGATTAALGFDTTNAVGPATYGSVLSMAAGVTKIGEGTLILSGANTYTGATTVSGGILKAGVASVANVSGAFGKNSAVSLANVAGATLDLNGFSTQIGSLTGGGTAGGNVNLGAVTLTVSGDNTGGAAYAGILSGTGGGLTKIGPGTHTLSGANTYTGATTVSAGTLKAGVASVANVSGAFGKNSAVSLANVAAALLDLNGFGTQIGSLTGGGTAGGNVNLGAAILTVGGDNTTPAAYAGILFGGTGGGLTKIGTGTLTLSGFNHNNYTGTTTVTGGTLIVDKTAAFAIYGNITLGDGATTPGLDILQLSGTGGNQIVDTSILTLNGTTTNAGTFRMNALSETIGGLVSTGGAGIVENGTAGTSTLTLNVNTTDRSFSGILQNGADGILGLTKTGTATQTLSGANTYTGATNVTAGRLNITGTLTSNVTVTGATLAGTGSTTGGLTTNAGSVIGINSAGATQAFTANAVNFAGATTLTLDGQPMLGTHTYTVLNYGSLANLANLSAPGYHGPSITDDIANSKVLLTITTGTRTWNQAAAGNWDVFTSANWAEGDGLFAQGDAVVFDDTATNGAVTLVGTLRPGSVTVNNSVTAYTLGGAGSISAWAGLTKSGSASLTLTGAHSYTGATAISAGTVNLTGSLSGGTAITVSGTGVLSQGSASVISGGTSITFSGTGVNTLAGANTFTGGVTLNSGTLNINRSSALGATSGAFVINGGTLDYPSQRNISPLSYPLTLNGDFTFGGGAGLAHYLQLSGPATLGTAAGMARTITISAGTLSLNGGIADGATASGITKAGAGLLVLSGANTFTGQLTVEAGTLVLSNAGNSALPVVLGKAGGQTGTLSLAGSTNKDFTMATGGTGEFVGAQLTVTGAIGGGGGLTKSGGGTLALTGTNTWSGPTTINGGTLQVGSGATSSITASPAIFLNHNGTLSLVNGVGDGPVSRLGDGIGITSTGGTLSYGNAASSGVVYAETVGPLVLTDGQSSVVLASAMNGGGGNRQTLTLSGLTPNGTATVTFSAPTTGPDATTNLIKVSGAAQTPAGQIIGPWATTGTSANDPTDYAVYDAASNIVPAAIAATAENTWAAGSNVTLGASTPLTETRSLNSLRYTGTTGTLVPNIGITGTLALAGHNLETLGILQGGTTHLMISSTGGVVRQPGTAPANLYLAHPAIPAYSSGYSITISAPIQNNTGALTLVKSGATTLTLSGTNTFSGGVALHAGTLVLDSPTALGSGTLTMAAGTTLTSSSRFFNAYNNAVTINGDISFGGIPGKILNLGAGGVSLGTAPGTGRYFSVLGYAGTPPPGQVGLVTIGGVISNGATAHSLGSGGTGTLILTGDNAYTGTTSVVGGTLILAVANAYAGGTVISGQSRLIARNAGALGSGDVHVSASHNGESGALNYVATADAPLSIGGTLALVSESRIISRSAIIGGTIGSAPNSARINVAGAASATNLTDSDGAPIPVRVNVYGTSFSGGTGTYTLLQAGPGSALNQATYSLNRVFNNTNFTVGAPTATASAITVPVTSAVPLTRAFWTGGLTGATEVWSASNGSTASNWSLNWSWDIGGTPSAVVPGAGTDVFFPFGHASSILGADMTIKSLNHISTTALTLNDDGYKLTIAPTASTAGITMDAAMGAVTLNPSVVLGSDQTWTNNSSNALTLNGAVSGSGTLTKAGTGLLVLSGFNSYTGTTTVSAGMLQAASTGALPGFSSAGQVSVASAATLAVNVGGGGEWTGANLDTLRTNASFAAGSSLGIDTTGATFSYGSNIGGSLGLTKLGTNTLTLTGDNTYTGQTIVNGGTLNLNNNGGIAIAGSGAKIKATPSASVIDVVIDSGGTVRLQRANQFASSVAIQVNTGGTLDLARSQTLFNLISSGTVTYGRGATIIITDPDYNVGSTNDIFANLSVGVLNVHGGTNTIHGDEGYGASADGDGNPAPGSLTIQNGQGGLVFTTAGANLTVSSDDVAAGKLILQDNIVSSQTSGVTSITNGFKQTYDDVNDTSVPTVSYGTLNGQLDLDGATRAITVTNTAATLLISADVINGGITKAGAGVLQLSGVNSYTGATTVNAGTLELGSAGSLTATTSVAVNTGGTFLLGNSDQISNGAELKLDGGTFTTAGHSETLGTLTLSSDSAIQLTLADNSQDLRFSDYVRTGGLLTIHSWTGPAFGTGTAGRLLFATGTLDASELSHVQFIGFGLGAQMISFGGGFDELVPVPEPSSVFVGLALFGLAGWRERRREQQARRATR